MSTRVCIRLRHVWMLIREQQLIWLLLRPFLLSVCSLSACAWGAGLLVFRSTHNFISLTILEHLSLYYHKTDGYRYGNKFKHIGSVWWCAYNLLDHILSLDNDDESKLFQTSHYYSEETMADIFPPT